MSNIRCVLLGDTAVGKSCMVITYVTGSFPWNYQPTEYNNRAQALLIDYSDDNDKDDANDNDDDDDLPYIWGPLDILQQETYNQSHRLFSKPDVFLVCFSVVNPISFQNIEKKWMPELRIYFPNVPFLLIGTQIDLRKDANILKILENDKQKPITKQQGKDLAKKLNAFKYIECSALTLKGIQLVFKQAKLAALESLKFKKIGKNQCCAIL